jgi:O-antigen ligase
MTAQKNTIMAKLNPAEGAAWPSSLSADPAPQRPITPSPLRPFIASPRLSLFFLLLCAAALGCALAVVAALPIQWLAGMCVILCGLFGVLLWWTMKWPVTPALQALLLSSFFFRMEVNLFPIFKYHENPPGLLISLNLLASLLLLGAHISERLRGHRSKSGWPLSFSLTFAFTWLWCSLCLIYVSETWIAFCMLWSFSANLLMCYAVTTGFANRQALRAAAITIAIATGVNGLVGTLQTSAGLFTNFPLIGTGTGEGQRSIGGGEILRAVGFMEKANGFAWGLVTVLPLLLALLILPATNFRRRERWLLAAASALGLMGLILSFARGSWMAFGFSLPVFVFLIYRALPAAERRRYTKRMALGAALLALLCLPFAGSIYTRLTEDDRGAAYSRKPLMDVALAMIAGNPWLGVGLANYEAEMRPYDKTPYRITDEFPWPVHNIYLHIAAEAGIPGALGFLLLIAIALRRGWWAIRSRDPLLRALSVGLIIGALAFLLTGIKELGSIGSPQLRQLFLCCGLLLAIDHVRRRNEEEAAQLG